MATFRKGTALIKEAAERKGGSSRFTPNIYWKDKDVKTVAFITPANEIPKVLIHQAVRIPDDNLPKGERRDNFLCRKDPSMVEESGGYCELCDRIGHKPAERFVALAVELEPVKEGKRTKALKIKYATFKRKDGSEGEVPRWGLVIQASSNFFAWLGAYDESKGDITEKAFEIERQGGQSPKYFFFPEDVPVPDFSEILDQLPDLEEELEKMGSDEKYASLGEVEAGSQDSWGDTPTPEAPTNSGADRASEFDKLREEVGATVGSY